MRALPHPYFSKLIGIPLSSPGQVAQSAGGKMYELSFCVEVVLSGEECRVYCTALYCTGEDPVWSVEGEYKYNEIMFI